MYFEVPLKPLILKIQESIFTFSSENSIVKIKFQFIVTDIQVLEEGH